VRHIARWAASRWQWVVLLLGLPLVLTMVVPDWMYSQTDFIDSWVYYGFFRHLEAYSVSMFPQTYYGTRLGWIVPGYLAYRLFTPFEATLILHLVFYCLAVGSLFVIVRRVSGSSSGLFAALAFGLYLPTVRALGSDYVDGAVIAYALLTVAFGLRGVEESKRVWTLASGIAAGLMLNSNIGAVLLFPSLVVWFVPRQLAGWRSLSLWVHAVLWAVGIALATAVLVAISVATGGDWDFFLNSLRWMRGQQGTNPWDVTGLSWVAASPWVFLPPATLLGTLLVWLRSRHDRLNAGQIKAIGSLGLVATVFVLFDFVGSGALLYWPFYASWLIPFTFLAIGVVLVPAARDFRTEAATLLVLVVGLGVSLAWPQFTRLPLFGLRGFALIVILVGVAALARSVVGSRIALAAAIFCLHGWLTLTNTYLPSRDRADVFQTVDRAVGFMEYFITDSQPRFLLTPPRKLGHYVQALTSVYLWGYTIASDRYPAVTAAQAALILPGATVVVISEEDGAASGFDEVFAPYGLSGAVKGSERVETIHGPLYLTVLYAKPRSGS
jgi:hypothetical protein